MRPPPTVEETYIAPSGPWASPVGRYFASRGLFSGSAPAKPSANTTQSPDGLPRASSGWNTTL